MFRLVDGDAVDSATLEAYAAWLGKDEARRLARFVKPERQRQFLIGRGLLRTMLGELLGIAPAAVLLEERPGLAPRAGNFGLSISHSGRWVACAVSRDCALGLDIEVMKPGRDFLALAEHAFDAQRCAALAQVPPASLARAFYRLWSEHEARIKLGEDAVRTEHIAHAELSIVLCAGRPFS